MLILDSEALSALAHGPPVRRQRTVAVIAGIRLRDEPVATVAAVLAEVVRGHPRDAAVFSVLRRERVSVIPVDRRVGIGAGRLLSAVDAGSELAVDAFVIAAADLAGGAVVATGDVDDLRALSAHAAAPIRIVGI